jgi:hypothetical protein
MVAIDKVCQELKYFTEDTSANGVSEVCKVIITLLRSKSLKPEDLTNKTIMLPNNASMRQWKNKTNIVNVIKAHVRDLPIAIEHDTSKFQSLTRTWSLPMKVESLCSVGLIIPLVLHAEVGRVHQAGTLLGKEFNRSVKGSKSRTKSRSKGRSKSRSKGRSKSRSKGRSKNRSRSKKSN